MNSQITRLAVARWCRAGRTPKDCPGGGRASADVWHDVEGRTGMGGGGGRGCAGGCGTGGGGRGAGGGGGEGGVAASAMPERGVEELCLRRYVCRTRLITYVELIEEF